MDGPTKGFLTRLKNTDEHFAQAIKSLVLGEQIGPERYEYILCLGLLFLEEYKKNGNEGDFEFAYFLVLSYSLQTQDYRPLVDFAFNNGLYPIAKAIIGADANNIEDVLLLRGMRGYSEDSITYTKEQKEKMWSVLRSESKYKAFIAPTSFGKSELVIKSLLNGNANKIAVIVPTKALIYQTYRNVKRISRALRRRIIVYDSEYRGEERFVAVFTQERAARFLQDSKVAFDAIFIDEAHNLFQKDERAVILARVIRLNKKMNPNSKVTYLSPLIKDANNLNVDGKSLVEAQRIDFNIKEYEAHYFNRNLVHFRYDRFLDAFYQVDRSFADWASYLRQMAGNKNLIYVRTPRKIEVLVRGLINVIPACRGQQDAEIDKILSIVEKYIDKDYLLYHALEHGIMYIHGKIPDFMRDYLLNKFISCGSIRYLVSNTCILEGVNCPFDALYVFDKVPPKLLINLAGRINRLNELFGAPPRLNRLFVPIHFVEADLLGDINLEPTVKHLRSSSKDDVENPILPLAKRSEKGEKIKRLEDDFLQNYNRDDLRTTLIKNGIYRDYSDFSQALPLIERRYGILSNHHEGLSTISLIAKLFFEGDLRELVIEPSLRHFASDKPLSFYENYVASYYYTDPKTKVAYFLEYVDYCAKYLKPIFIGRSFGEENQDGIRVSDGLYVRPHTKSKEDRVNYAVIKMKIEDDFVSYDLAKYVKALFDFALIGEDDYNLFLYGTSDKKKIDLLKMGFNLQLIAFLEEYGLYDELRFVDGAIACDDEKFKKALEQQDDLIQFEIRKALGD